MGWLETPIPQLTERLLTAEILLLVFISIWWFKQILIEAKEKVLTVLGVWVIVLAGCLGILFQSWWKIDLSLTIALSLMLSVALLDSNRLLSSFILILFIRPWELLNLGESAMAEGLVSLPKIWLLFVILVGLSRFSKQTFRLSLNSIDWAVFGFIAWMFIPILIRGQSEDIKNFVDTLLSAGVVYFCLRWYRSTEQVVHPVFTITSRTLNGVAKPDQSVRSLETVFVGVGIFLILIPFLQRLTDLSNLDGVRAEAFGLFANSNDLASLIVFCLPFIIGKLSQTKWVWIGLGLLAIYLTQSRGGFLGLVVGLGTYYWASKQKTIPSLKHLLIIGGGGIIGILLFGMVLHRDPSDLQISSLGRINFWVAAARMAFYSPLVGVGYGHFPQNFETYALEFLESGERTAHSSLFLVLAEGGVVGLLIYSFIFKEAFKKAWAHRIQQPKIFAALSGYGVTMLFLSHSYLFFSFVLLGMVSSLETETETVR